jgi:hypothetical protein
MRQIRVLVSEHRHHMLSAFAVSAAIFLTLCGVNHLGIGGINVNPWLLAGGFAAAEIGRSIMCFGVKLNNTTMEYSGVLIQGIAWWIWSVNFTFLEGKTGWILVFHLICPAVLLSAMPVTAHYLRKQIIDAPN